MQSLDHAARKVLDDLAGKRKPQNYTKAMQDFRKHKNGEEVPEFSAIAFSISESQRQAEILEALLISGCPYLEIEEAFRVPAESVRIYAELFFDTSVFRTDLDRLEYLEDYPDPFGRDLKSKAVSLGYDFVLFTFASLIPKTPSQKKLLERMFMATAYKAMSMNYSGIKSETNRLAVKHAELMIKAFELLTKVNAEATPENYDLVSLLAAQPEIGPSLKPGSEEIV